MARFRGFSTIGQYKKFALTDYELVKRDLLNALNIREGELPGRPEFGTRLWNFMFEVNDQDTVRNITNEIERIVTYDPRVELNDLIVTQDVHGIILELVVTIRPNQNPEALFIKFDEESATAAFV
jgi:phage baseplate assembly protein W